MSTAGVISSDRRLVPTQVDVAPLQPDEVRVDVAFCGLCGSDLHMFFDSPTPATGHILGHEFSGVVGQVGAAVDDWASGDRVVVMPIDPCGQCTGCTHRDGVCLTGLLQGPGLGRAGGLGQSVAIPAHMLHRVPDTLSLQDAALTEPLAVAVRGTRRARVRDGEAVVVVGAGPIGLLTVAALKARGVARILIIEPNSRRREFASRLGTLVATPEFAGSAIADHFPEGIGAVIDCSGAATVLQDAIDLVSYGGRVVLVGVPIVPSQVQALSIVTKELTIVGSTAYSTADFAEALAHLGAGRVDAKSLITSVVSLDQIDAKLRELVSGESTDIKVLVRQSTEFN